MSSKGNLAGARQAGFVEVSHAADCAIRVWAPDLASLFVQAAMGLNSISGLEMGAGGRVRRQIGLRASDAEGLLVAFLSELLYRLEAELLAFDEFHLDVSKVKVVGEMKGARVRSLARPVKAITFHNLVIRESAEGLETQVVVDV